MGPAALRRLSPVKSCKTGICGSVPLTPASIAFLEEIGVWRDASTHRAAPYDCMRVWDASGSGSIVFDAGEADASSLGHIVENREILQALLQCAQALPCIELCWGHALETMSSAGSGWLATCSTGREFHTALAIGADGAQSKARQLLGMPTREWSYAQTAIVATVGLAHGHAATCWQVFLESGPLAMLPLADPLKVAIVWSFGRCSTSSNCGFVRRGVRRRTQSGDRPYWPGL
jgi:2-octaprenylphenol hydroxylase